MIDKLISSSAIIAKVISDNNLQEKDLRIADVRAWIGEAVEKIGAVTQLNHKTEIIDIKGYQAQLPRDLYKLGQVAYSQDGQGWLPMIKSSASFPVNHGNNCTNNSDPKMIIPDEAILQLTKTLFNLTDDTAALTKLNENPGIRTTLATLIDIHTVDKQYGFNNLSKYLQYDIKPGHIVCPMRDGKLKVAYYAVYTDDDGMPMIPDMQSYQEAIYWYVTMKMFYSEYIKGKIPQYIYNDMKNSWNFYAKQAYAEAMLPNIDGLEAIKNDWNNLMPELSHHGNFFNTLGDEQIIYNHN